MQKIKHVIDAIGVAAITGNVIGVLPTIATVLAIVWYIIQITDHYKNKNRPED